MRVCYVINSLEGGGASSPVPAVADLLRAHGCEVAVLALTARDGRGRAAIEAAGFEVAVRDGGERDHLAALRWLSREVARRRPDLLWTSLTRATLLGQIVGQRRGVRVVSWQHSVYLKPANAWLLRLRRRRSRLWVADSASVAALTHERLRVPRDQIAVWPLFRATEDAPVAKPWRPGEPLRVGSLGRLHCVKGYDVLLAALARMNQNGFTAPAPIEVAIAGDGALRGALEAQAHAAGLDRVRFVGFVEPRPFLAGLHLYVQPSRSEGLCIAAHEAMQASLPAVVSAVGEMPLSVVHGVTGLVTPPGDGAALAAALARMLGDPARMADMGEASRQRMIDLFSQKRFEAAGADALCRAMA